MLRLHSLQEDVASALQIEERQFEVEQEENGYWLDRLLASYQSRYYRGDPDEVYLHFISKRREVLDGLTKDSAREMLRKLLPSPPRTRYTALIMKPQLPMQLRLMQAAQHVLDLTEGNHTALAIGAMAAAVGCAWIVRSYIKSRSS